MTRSAACSQHLSPAQIQANPGIVQTYEALLGGTKGSLWHDYITYLHRLEHFNFGISTSNYPSPVSVVVGRTLPYSIVLVGVAFLIAFLLGTAIGMIAAWRRGGVVDSVLVPAFMSLGAFPAFFTALLGVYFLGLRLHWFPIQHAYNSDLTPGLNWSFLSSAFRHAQLPALVIVGAYAGGWVLNMRTLMINTIDEDYVGVAHAKGLRDRRVMTRYAGRNAILPRAERLRGAVRDGGRRRRGDRVRLQLSRRGPDAAAGGARRRLPARAGAARRPLAVRDRGELHHGPPQLRPRPARAHELMPKLHLPGWAQLLLRNPKSRIGIVILLFMIVIAVIAPLISVADPNGFSLDAHQAPSWHHLFGTTDQGSDVWSQVVVGTRRSLLLGAAAGALATLIAATLGILAAYAGGIVDEVINFLINVFLVIPPIPLLVVISGFLKNRGMSTMILVLGLVLWAFEARILRTQALQLKNRDFVLRREGRGRVDTTDRLRRADAEHDQPHRGGVRARLLHRAAHRRRARVPRPRQPLAARAGA